MTKKENKLKCSECNTLLSLDEVLTAPNPFAPEETLQCCPHCLTIDKIYSLCDVPRCDSIATCGYPSKSGYRRTCGYHFLPEVNNNDRQKKKTRK